MSLFYFFGGDGTDRAGLGGGCMPRRCTPAPSSAPGMTTQHRQQRRPCQNQGGASTRADHAHSRPRTSTHSRTLDTLHRSALDIRQAAPGRSHRRRAGSVSDRARPNGQNYCKQKYSFFMCKPLDKRNKIVYNIDSKQTYLHHHKTGGQSHEKVLPRYQRRE